MLRDGIGIKGCGIVGAVLALLLLLAGGHGARTQEASATLTIHHRWCPAGYAGPDYFGTCHDSPLADWMLYMRGPVSQEGTTDAQGDLTFAGLPPGTYTVFNGGGPTDFVSLVASCAPAAKPGTEFPSATEQLRGSPGTYAVELTLGAGEEVICDFFVIPADLTGAEETAPPVNTAIVDCTVEPRPYEEVVALVGVLGTSVPAAARRPDPSALPTGEPVDEVTRREITAAATLLIACGNSGDSLRLFALYTDDALRSLGPLPASTIEAVATPQPGGQTVRLVSVLDVLRLADGRVSAIVTLARSSASTDTDSLVMIFTRVGGVWLLDDVYEDFLLGDELVTIDEALGTPPAKADL